MSFSESLLKPGTVGLAEAGGGREAGEHLMTGPGGNS